MSMPPKPDEADQAVLLGRAWLERGRGEAAHGQLQRALDLDPGHGPAHRFMAYWHVRQEDFAAALYHLETALALLGEDRQLQSEHLLLRQLAGHPLPPPEYQGSGQGKIRFRTAYKGTHHRSGWRYAMDALKPLHTPGGALFEGFLEDPFAWQHPRSGVRPGPELLRALRSQRFDIRLSSEELGIVPFSEPWVGFLHNPPGMPGWFHQEESPQAIFSKRVWLESLRHCRGLFVLSSSLAGWLRDRTDIPVSVLIHPTEIPKERFSPDRFRANPNKRIIQVGWWLRSQSAIFRLPVPRDNPLGYSKVRLVPRFFPGAKDYLDGLLERECEALGLGPGVLLDENTEQWRHLSDQDYDAMLAENIVFLSLFGASANNTVVECLARATPLLVNPLPAVKEYLGEDYPLYYKDLEEAAAKVQDPGRLLAAHEHLLACETRTKLGAEHFRRSFEHSEVYRSL